MDPTAQISSGWNALIAFVTKHWLAFLLVVAGLLALFLRFRNDIASKFTGLPSWAKSFLKISGFAVPVGFVLFAGNVVFAACAGHTPCGMAEVSTGFWTKIFGYLAGIGGSIGLGITAFPAPDMLDAVDDHSGRDIAFTPGAAQEFAMYLKTPINRTANGKPLIAVDTVLSIDTTIDRVSTGSGTLLHDDYARLLEYLQIDVEQFGTILDQKTGLGPVLDLGISFYGNGFNRPDAPVASLPVAGAGTTHTALTKYFTYPWAQRYMADPASTAPWLGFLDNTKFSFRVAPSTCLQGEGLTTDALLTGTSHVRCSTSYVMHSHWYYPKLAFWRLQQKSSGSDGIVFDGFGQTGPEATVPVDEIHTIGIVSNNKGLPGNLDPSTITQIIAPQFGINDVKNIDHFVDNRIKAQFDGSSPARNASTDGNHSMATANGAGSMAGLLFFLLRQPSLNMRSGNMGKLTAKDALQARFTFSTPRTGQDYLLYGSLRRLQAGKVPAWRVLSGNLLPESIDVQRAFNQRAAK